MKLNFDEIGFNNPVWIDIQFSSFSNWHETYLTHYLYFFNFITFVHHFLLNSCSALFCVLYSSDTILEKKSVVVQPQVQLLRTFTIGQSIGCLDCGSLLACCLLSHFSGIITQIQEL